MLVYLWQADGKRRYRGVTDDDTRARQAAEAALATGRASTARIEAATLVTRADAMSVHYKKTGLSWTAKRTGKGVTWARQAA